VTHTLDFVVRHGYALLFFWVLAEQGALPLPSAPLLLACGALAKDGRLAPFWIVITGLAACLIADNFWFVLGRRRGAKVLRFGRFILFDTLGALTWIVVFTGLGYIFSSELDKVGDYAARMGAWVAVLAGGLLAAYIGWKFVQRQRFLKKLAVARITPEELRQKLESGEEIVVVDVRSTLESDLDSVPGALRIPLEELETRHNEIPRGHDIILFCS
jgi:membrane protein DedA with SNARE-associated domain